MVQSPPGTQDSPCTAPGSVSEPTTGRAAAAPQLPLLVSAAANGTWAVAEPEIGPMSPTITQLPTERQPMSGVPAAFIADDDDGMLSNWPCAHVPCASSTVYSSVPYSAVV